MNRAQRMQLEKTIGMPLEEALKIQKAPETAETVTAQLDKEAAQIQSQAANNFRVAVAALEVAVGIFSAAVALDAITRKAFNGRGLIRTARIGRRLAGRSLGRLGTRIASSRIGTMVSSAAGRIGASSVARTAGRFARGLGPGLIASAAGSVLNYGGAKMKEKGYEKTGAALDIAGKAASFGGMGAMIGSIIPGVGTAIGGAVGALVGTIYGIITNWEAVKKMVSDSFTAVVDAVKAIIQGAKWLGGKLFDIGKWLVENNPIYQAFSWLRDKIKTFKFSDLFGGGSEATAAQNTAQNTEEKKPGFLSRVGSFFSGSEVATATNARAAATTPVVAAAVTRTTNEMQSDTRAVINRNAAPVINLPDNATLQQQVTELIRQAAVSNQKLDALANQTITVNMDGQKVGNIIRRSAMAASTGASTARSNG